MRKQWRMGKKKKKKEKKKKIKEKGRKRKWREAKIQCRAYLTSSM